MYCMGSPEEGGPEGPNPGDANSGGANPGGPKPGKGLLDFYALLVQKEYTKISKRTNTDYINWSKFFREKAKIENEKGLTNKQTSHWD